MDLRTYQSDAIQALRSALAGGLLRVMLYSPTGSGKTEIAMQMIRSARAKDKRVAFVVNRKALVEQTSRRLHRAGIEHGIIQAENTNRIDSPVLVCSVDTIHIRGLPDVDLIVIDEAHGVAGNSKYRNLLFKRSALPVIGLSATPFSVGLGKFYKELHGPLFETLVTATTIRDLIDLGFLVDVDVFAPSTPDLSRVQIRRGKDGELDFVESALAAAVDLPDLIGDIVANWFRLAAGKPTVCFATSIAHSKHIVESFRARGVAAEHLDCHADDDTRKAVMARFERGETTVISNVALLAEGWDCPTTDVMILARPTKSLIRWIQMAGRVLRPAPGKSRALLLDHSGTTARLGFPTDDLPLKLNDGRPPKHGQTESKGSLPKECPKCRYMKPARVHACPNCGFKPERQSDVTVRDGELVPMQRAKKAGREGKQAVYSGLLRIAAERDYSSGWVAHKYRAYFGVWPRDLHDDEADPTPALRSWVTSQSIRFAKSKEAGHAAAR